MDRLMITKVYFVAVIVGLSHGTTCEIGFCRFHNVLSTSQNCDIPADTLCSGKPYCNGNGRCFKDNGIENVYCDCSDDTYGDTCQHVYNKTLNIYCTHDADCGGDTHGRCEPDETGTQRKCQCEPGFHGNRCELETRLFLSDSGMCQNGGFQYKQGETIGCYCPCGYEGEHCADLSPKLVFHVDCDWKICNNRGYCNLDSNSIFFCLCRLGFEGRFCEKNIYHRSTVRSTTLLNATRSSTLLSSTQLSTRTTTVTKGIPDESTVITSPTIHTNTMKPKTTTATLQNKVCNISYKTRCRNGGTCVYNGFTFEYNCECQCGYFGPFCEFSSDTRRSDYRNWCVTVNNTCHGEGICLLDRNTCNFECICPAGYTGLYCNDKKTSTCGPWIGCAHVLCDHGKCVVDKCGTPYCERTDSSSSSSTPISAYTVVPVLISVVITTIVVIFIIYKFRKRRRPLSSAAEYERGSPQEDNLRNVRPNGTSVSNPIYSTSVSTPVSIDLPKPVVPSDLPTYEEACENPPSYADIAQGYTHVV